jgi:death-on-curing family protein
MIRTKYPTVEELIEINKRVLQEIKVKKADRSALTLSGKGILEIIVNDMKMNKGDTYDKAIVLLKGIIQRHPFESGNRRTALVATAGFLNINDRKIKIVHDTSVLQGIREGYYRDKEIKEWIKGGKIRAFRR